MKSLIVFTAALALGGTAFAAGQSHGIVDTVKQDAHQIGSAFRQDMHRIARADKFRQQQAADQHRLQSGTHAMGAAPANDTVTTSRQARMDAAYANWQRSHR